MKKSVLLIAVLCIASAHAQDKGAKKNRYASPLCLGGFCFNKLLPTPKQLTARYGPGTKTQSFWCYAVPDQRAYISLHGYDGPETSWIDGIFVSATPNCLTNASRLARPRTPFPILQTRERVRLGDSYEKVLRTYGQPSFTKDGDDYAGMVVSSDPTFKAPQFYERALVYTYAFDDSIQGIFYFRKGKVTAISIWHLPQRSDSTDGPQR